MRRYVPLLVAGVALIATACRDTVAPTTQATEFASLADRSYSLLSDQVDDANAQTLTFIIKAEGNTVRVGEFTLTFGANAVCALDSGYGEALWRLPCESLGEDIEITAKVFSSQGNSYVTFYPDIRFNPEVDVTIAVYRPEIIGGRLTRKERRDYDIWYSRRVGRSTLFIDEAWNDPELGTHFDTRTGRIWREIRHFSNWLTRVGFCTDNPSDASCGGAPVVRD
jgi:hypothetical protein